MKQEGLPDLLEALGELFLLPGAFDRARFEALGRTSWTGLGITPTLQALLIQDCRDLDVAYAGLFLHGGERATIHLEGSVQRTGLLADPETLQSLQSVYSVAGIRPDPSFQADHLGIQLALLAHLLRSLAEAPRPRARQIECAARVLLEDHLAPLAWRIGADLEHPSVHPVYRTAGHLVQRVLDLSAQVLARKLATLRTYPSTHERRTHAPST